MIRENVPRLWFPPLTDYRADGSLDFPRMEQRLARVYPWCRGVLVPGSTGDGWLLSQTQQEEIVRRFLKGFSFGRFRLFLGALLPTVEETKAAVTRWCSVLRECAGAEEDRAAMAALGVEGFVVCLPHGAEAEDAQRAALEELLSLGLPTAFYQLPQVTGALASPALVASLAERYPNLLFAKDSGGGDELACSGLLGGRLMLLRGAEGDPTALLRGPSPAYDGLLLSTVNCFPEEYAALVAGTGDYGAYGKVIGRVFDAAARAPVSNAFSDANRAMDHVLYWGKKTLEQPAPLCIGGVPLPMELVETAYRAMEQEDLVPDTGYGR